METTRYFVGIRIELAAGVQLGHDDLRGGDSFIGVHIDGDAAAVVDYSDGESSSCTVTLISVQCLAKGFVDGVVDYFIHQMMQSSFACGTDGTSPDATGRLRGLRVL